MTLKVVVDDLERLPWCVMTLSVAVDDLEGC